MSGGAVKLRERLAGRIQMCINTVKTHPDPHVRDEMQIRALAYMNACEDAENDDEVNALVDLWKAVSRVESSHGLEEPWLRPVKDAFLAVEKVWTGKK